MPRWSEETRERCKAAGTFNRPRLRSDQEIEKMREELRSGKTLRAIADEEGVSYQRIAQLVGGVRQMKEWNKTYSVYPGIDNWMKYNHITYAQFNSLLGYANTSSAQANLAQRLMGKTDIRKSLIDSILSVTGMTYEEAFSLERR